MTISMEPIGGALGARISGVDLSRPLDAETFAQVHRAYLERHLVAFPGQKLTPEALIAFSRRFGPLESHVLEQYHHPQYAEVMILSNVVENGKPLGLADAGSYWHSDVSYTPRPSRATVLYALEVPEAGGDTLFANCRLAYEELPEPLQARLEGLRGVHNYGWRADQETAARGIRPPLTAAQRAATPTVTHPAVRRHPETGRPALYVNPGFTLALEGLPEAEGAALLEQVFAHCLRERYRIRYAWHAGDVVLWDNAAVIHKATAVELPPGRRRTLWRTIISGDVPR